MQITHHSKRVESILIRKMELALGYTFVSLTEYCSFEHETADFQTHYGRVNRGKYQSDVNRRSEFTQFKAENAKKCIVTINTYLDV